MLFCFGSQESLSAFEAWTKGLIKLWHPRQKRPGRKWGSPQVENEYLWDSIISVHLRDSVEKQSRLWSFFYIFCQIKFISYLILVKQVTHQSHCYLWYLSVSSHFGNFILVVFGNEVTKISCNSLFIFHFVFPILPCKRKTLFRKSHNLP